MQQQSLTNNSNVPNLNTITSTPVINGADVVVSLSGDSSDLAVQGAASVVLLPEKVDEIFSRKQMRDYNKLIKPLSEEFGERRAKQQAAARRKEEERSRRRKQDKDRSIERMISRDRLFICDEDDLKSAELTFEQMEKLSIARKKNLERKVKKKRELPYSFVVAALSCCENDFCFPDDLCSRCVMDHSVVRTESGDNPYDDCDFYHDRRAPSPVLDHVFEALRNVRSGLRSLSDFNVTWDEFADLFPTLDPGVSDMCKYVFTRLFELLSELRPSNVLFTALIDTFVYFCHVVSCRSFQEFSRISYWYARSMYGLKSIVRSIGFMMVSSGIYQITRALHDSLFSDKVNTESGFADMDVFLSSVNVFLESEIVQKLRTLFMGLVSFQLFDRDVSKELNRALGTPERMSYVEFFKHCVDCVRVLMRALDTLYQGSTLSSVFMGVDPLVSISRQVKELLAYKDRLYTGLPTPGYKCQRQFMIEAEDILSNMDVLSGTISPLRVASKQLAADRMELEFVMNSVRSSVAGHRRAMPFAVVLHGNPGIGKSKILPLINHLWSNVKGRVFEDPHVYVRNMTSQYWEGYMPFSHPIIHYSEVGRVAKTVAQSQGDEYINELTSVVDSLPYLCDMAFGEKGRVFACPELVIMDTNNESLNLDILVNNPAAYRRRFLYIEPRVKPEFLVPGTCRIDPHASCNAGGDILDRWTFQVKIMEPINEKSSSPVFLMNHEKDANVFRLSEVLNKLFSNHVSHEVRMVETFRDKSAFEAYLPKTPVQILCPVGTESAEAEGERPMEMPVYNRCVSLGAKVSQGFADLHSFILMFCSHLFSIGHLFGRISFAKYASFMSRRHREENIYRPISFSVCLVILALSACLFLLGDWISPFLLVGVAVYLFITPYLLHGISYVGEHVIKDAIDELEDKLASKVYSFWYFLGYTEGYSPPSWLNFSLVGRLTVVATSIATFWLAWRYVTKGKVNPGKTESSSFTNTGAVAQELKQMEDTYHCGQSYKRIPIRNHALWNVREVGAPALCTTDLSSLFRSIGSSIRHCIVMSERPTETYLFGIKEDLALINAHAFGKRAYPILVRVSSMGYAGSGEVRFDTILREDDVVDVSPDVLLIRLIGIRFKDRMKHVASDLIFPPLVKSLIGVDKVFSTYDPELTVEMNDTRLGKYTIKGLWSYEWPNHRNGVCGLPLLVEKGNGVCIAGIHAASATVGLSYAVPVVSSDIEAAIATMFTKCTYFRAVSESDDCMELVDPSPKSCFTYEVLQGLHYKGALNKEVHINSRSKLMQTPYADHVEELLFDTLECVPSKRFGRPLMKPSGRLGEYVSPYNEALRPMARQKKPLDPAVMKKVIHYLSDHFVAQLRKKGVTSLSPLTIDCAINGAPDDPFIKRMATKTAAGFGWKGPKGAYLPITRETPLDVYREPTTELLESVQIMLRDYENGVSKGIVHKGQLKDEPRSEEKIKQGKTRLFYMSPVHAIIVARMMLAPFFSLLVQFGEVFGAHVGINMHADADKFVQALKEFSDLYMSGDFKDFDITMPTEVGMAVGTIIVNVLEALGFNERALRIVRGVLSDQTLPLIEVLGDIFMAPGEKPSGVYGTAEDNCARNLVLLVYYWFACEESEGLDFFEQVKPGTYGDDGANAIKRAVAHWFNNLRFAQFCHDVYGMTYTSSDKAALLNEFESLDQLSFLKRTFRVHPDLGHYVAQLDPDSLFRSSRWYLPSDMVTRTDQLSDSTVALCWEVFFHVSKEKYEKFRVRLADIVSKYLEIPVEILHVRYPTWQAIEVAIHSDF